MTTSSIDLEYGSKVERNSQLNQHQAQRRATTSVISSSEAVQPKGSSSRRVNSEPIPGPNPLTRPVPTRVPFTLARAKTVMFQPEKPVGPAPGFFKSLSAILKSSWLNVMLVFIPISWVLNFTLSSSYQNKDTLVFVFSFLAIIPLAKLLAFATDELSKRVGQTLAGLINATLGNAVEMIVAIIALVKCQIAIVQASLIGSILSNLLLVLGMCFFAGGLKFSEQGFGVSITQLNSSLLTLSVIAVLLPAAFHLFDTANNNTEISDILSVSRGVAVVLLFIYASYLVFQLYSHTVLYDDKNEDVFRSTKYNLKKRKSTDTSAPSKLDSAVIETSNDHFNGDPEQGCVAANEEKSEEEEPELNLFMALFLLAAVTVLVAVTAEWLVDSIGGLTSKGKISEMFVGLILLPIVGNAAEHVTAVTVSVKDKLNLSLGVAVGSSIQISLFVIPFTVILGWILKKPMSFLFDPYESVVLFLSVLTVNYVVQDGKSNWLEGMILMCLYVILAITFWFYPGSSNTPGTPTC